MIDYTRDEFIRPGDVYDAVFDAVGRTSFARCKPKIKPGGLFIVTDFGPHAQNPVLVAWTRFFGSRKVLLPIPKYTKDDVRFIKGLIESGHYRAVVDRCYPLEDAAEATRYVETEQRTGNVVLTIG